VRLLAACRLACSYTLGASAAAQDPGNRYLLLHAEPAGRALEVCACVAFAIPEKGTARPSSFHLLLLLLYLNFFFFFFFFFTLPSALKT
jgi:hypothetical protein